MTGQTVLYALTSGPFVLALSAWAKLYWDRRRQWPDAIALLALGIVTGNATFAVATFLYYQIRPSPSSLPPWQDPQVLTFGLLFLFAPAGMVLGFVAGVRGAPKWLIWILELASLPLLLVGLMAGSAI